MGKFIRTVMRTPSHAHIQRVGAVRRGAARDLLERVYAQVERDFGMLAPPISLHSAAPEATAASWAILRESLVATGLVSRSGKEAVAAAVSLGNACPYCVEIHSATLYGLLRGSDPAAIGADRIGEVADPRLRELAGWARASGDREAAARPGTSFPVEQTPELIGTAVTFQYLNRMVNVFLADSPLPPAVPPRARARALRVFGRVMRTLARNEVEPGASLDLLPAAPLPDDLAWAAGNPTVAEAFARAAAALEEAGRRSVPEPVRALVTARLADWDGRPMGPSRAWADAALAGLPAADLPAGKLALLTAMASYQVDEGVIEAVRAGGTEDRALVEITAWASFTAARRVGGWMRTSDTWPRTVEPVVEEPAAPPAKPRRRRPTRGVA
jgi:AhpD family alkylhydroperoxidase